MMTGPKFSSVHTNFSLVCYGSALLLQAIKGIFHWVYGILLGVFVNEEERDYE